MRASSPTLLGAALVWLIVAITGATAQPQLQATTAPAGPSARTVDLPRLFRDSANWTYQLQASKVPELLRTNYDILVIDAFFGGTRADVERLQRKPLGGRRIVLAYLSIGEAENYRYYWQDCCAGSQRPSWLYTENARWKGNFRVRFWQQPWKDIIYRSPTSYLKRIADLGFDGVYLDRIDVYSELSASGVNPRREMVTFVKELSTAGRTMRPGFLVIAQNAEELATDDSYVAVIDGIAKEDLFYGIGAEGRRNTADMVKSQLNPLLLARQKGKHILVVEYLQKPETVEKARLEIMEHGFVPYFAPRQLEKLQVENLEEDPSH